MEQVAASPTTPTAGAGRKEGAMSKQTNFHKALQKAINASIKADIELQTFASLLKFEGFDLQEPKIAFVNEDSILITYEDEEMYAEEAIRLMEQNGVITLEDFTNPIRFKKRNNK